MKALRREGFGDLVAKGFYAVTSSILKDLIYLVGEIPASISELTFE